MQDWLTPSAAHFMFIIIPGGKGKVNINLWLQMGFVPTAWMRSANIRFRKRFESLTSEPYFLPRNRLNY